MAFEGMDVGQVTAAAKSLELNAAQVDTVASSISAQIDRAMTLWHGSDSARLHSDWNSQRASFRRVSEMLRTMASELRHNIDQQSGASAVTGGFVGGVGGGGWGGLPGFMEAFAHAGEPISDLGNVHDAIDLALKIGDIETDGNLSKIIGDSGLGKFFTASDLAKYVDAAKVGKIFDGAGTVLSGVGLVTDSAAFTKDVSTGDAGDAIMDGKDAVVDGVATFVPEVGLPLAAANDVLNGFINATTPVSPASQDSLLNFEAHQLFGRPESQLTSQQASELADRYTGPFGMVSMMSDKMNQTSASVADGLCDSIHPIENLWRSL